MKYLIIGEPCLDVIHKHNGETARSYGGILYSVIAMSVFCRSEDLIVPIMNIGEDESRNVKILLSQYKNIDTSGINTIEFPTRRVNLDYTLYGANNERFETSTQPTHPIDYSLIEKFLQDADAILINMISGTDITLETMKNIRKNFKGYIHIDIHNLVMKTSDDGMRSYTNPVSWMDWCTNADIVQMNEKEISFLSKETKNEYKVVEKILTDEGKSVKGVILTRGLSGVSGYTQKMKTYGDEKFLDIDKKDLSAIENPDFVDSTGCGDVFASAFVYEFSKDGNFDKALHFGNRMASYNTSLEGIDQLFKLVN